MFASGGGEARKVDPRTRESLENLLRRVENSDARDFADSYNNDTRFEKARKRKYSLAAEFYFRPKRERWFAYQSLPPTHPPPPSSLLPPPGKYFFRPKRNTDYYSSIWRVIASDERRGGQLERGRERGKKKRARQLSTTEGKEKLGHLGRKQPIKV